MPEREEGEARSSARLELEELLLGMREGSPEAFAQFVRAYEPHIRRVVRSRLRNDLRKKFDSDDFAQQVWEGFFKSPDWTTRCGSPEQLIAYLVGMANHEFARVARAQFRGKRDLRREGSLDDMATVQELQVRDPSPADVAAMHDELERLTRGRPKKHAAIIWLRHAGESCREIAAKLHMHVRTVRKVLARLDPRKGRHQRRAKDQVLSCRGLVPRRFTLAANKQEETEETEKSTRPIPPLSLFPPVRVPFESSLLVGCSDDRETPPGQARWCGSSLPHHPRLRVGFLSKVPTAA